MVSFIDYEIFTLEGSDGFRRGDCDSFTDHSLVAGEWVQHFWGENKQIKNHRGKRKFESYIVGQGLT